MSEPPIFHRRQTKIVGQVWVIEKTGEVYNDYEKYLRRYGTIPNDVKFVPFTDNYAGATSTLR